MNEGQKEREQPVVPLVSRTYFYFTVMIKYYEYMLYSYISTFLGATLLIFKGGSLRLFAIEIEEKIGASINSCCHKWKSNGVFWIFSSIQFIYITPSPNNCHLRAPYKKQPVYGSQQIALNLQFVPVSQLRVLLYYCSLVWFT